MPRFKIRIPDKGGRSIDNYKMVYTPKKVSSRHVIIYASNEDQASKRARKLYDGTFVMLGEVDENDKLIKKPKIKQLKGDEEDE